MNNFVFENPTKIIFGQGQIARIAGDPRCQSADYLWRRKREKNRGPG